MTSPRPVRFKDSRTVMLTRKAVKDALDKANVLNSDKFVLVGLSGGADSLALAAATAWVAERHSFNAGAVIVNHNLQEGSQQVAEEAAEQARKLGLRPVIIKNVVVPEANTAGGPENAARLARYEAFEQALDLTGGTHILTAHTKNDNAEQVLISLTRGSGTRSLAGIRKERDYLLRPFLTTVGRADTEKACADQKLNVWNDPQNKHTVYTRVRVRETIIPMLQEQLGDQVVDSLNRTAELAAADADAFDWLVEKMIKDITVVVEDENISVPVEAFADIPEAVVSRIVRKLIADHFGEHPTFEQTSNIVKLITNWHGQKLINAEGVVARRADGKLIFSRS